MASLNKHRCGQSIKKKNKNKPQLYQGKSIRGEGEVSEGY